MGYEDDGYCVATELDERLQCYCARYGRLPDTLPVTLDEWVLLAERIWGGYPLKFVPTHYGGVQLRLVSEIFDIGDATIVRP